MPTMSTASRSRNSVPVSVFSSPPKTRCRSCLFPSAPAMSSLESFVWKRDGQLEQNRRQQNLLSSPNRHRGERPDHRRQQRPGSRPQHTMARIGGSEEGPLTGRLQQLPAGLRENEIGGRHVPILRVGL